MYDYEEKILISQDSMEEDCTNCPYKGINCKNQCSKIKSVTPLWLKQLGY